MAKKINAKLVLELLGKGMSGREIARTRRIAPQSVKKVREAAEHKPGQVMEVDWNGTTMELFCDATGEVATAHLFRLYAQAASGE
jgi:hypothetical protein